VESWTELSRVQTAAEERLRKRFPQRRVWCKPARNNPDASVCLFVSRRGCIDLTLRPRTVTSERDGELTYVTLAWLCNDLQALLVNANAAYRHDKDQRRLLRLCLADEHGRRQLDTRERARILGPLMRSPQVDALEQALRELTLRHSQCQRASETLEALRHQKEKSTQQHAQAKERQLEALQNENARLVAEAARLTQEKEQMAAQLKQQNQELARKQTALKLMERRIKDMETDFAMRYADLTNAAIQADRLMQETRQELEDKTKKLQYHQATTAAALERALSEARDKEQLRRTVREAEEQHTALLDRHYMMRRGFESVLVREAQVDRLWVGDALVAQGRMQSGTECYWEIPIDDEPRRVYLCATCASHSLTPPPTLRLIKCGEESMTLRHSHLSLVLPTQLKGPDYHVCNECLCLNVAKQ
jgi:DNA repair exonuclease SbcCD ATPase subunit